MIRTFFLFLLVIVPLYGQNLYTAVDFLKLPIDPVAIGRGETATASEENLNSVGLNPAHINQINNWEGFYNRQSIGNYLPDDFSYFAGGLGYRINDKNVVALFARRFGFGTTVLRGSQENFSEQNKPYDMAIGLVYGREFREHLSGGIGVKFLRSSFGKVSANSWAFDLGIKRQNLLPCLTVATAADIESQLIESIRKPASSSGITVGAALLNAGPHIAYLDDDQGNPIPQRLRIGLAYQAVSSDIFGLQALFDFEKELVHWNEENSKADSYYKAWFTGWKGETFKEAIYHFGAEIQLISILKLRYGYRYEPFQQFLEKGVSTLGFSVETKYASLHYGKWIDKDNISPLNRGSYVLGISIGAIRF